MDDLWKKTNLFFRRENPMNDELLDKMKFLDLRWLTTNWDDVLAVAKQTSPSYHRFLTQVIDQEHANKKERVRLSRIKRANIEQPLVMETFPFTKQSNLKKQLVMEMFDSLDYMTKSRDLIFIGPTGCGKTGLATSFLIHAINNNYRGCFIDFKQLIELLYKSLADHSDKKVINRFQDYDCLCIDEIGYAPVSQEQAGLFFELMKKRHKKGATIITTQLGFEEWGTFLKNSHLTAALLDRLTEDCVVFNMKKCISIRPKKVIYGTDDK